MAAKVDGSVDCLLKPPPINCPCGFKGCTKVGQPVGKRGHVRGCICPRCRGSRNRDKGRRAQAKAGRAIGIARSNLSPGHEENAPGAVRFESKDGLQSQPIFTRYDKAKEQSEACRPIGDNRPFVFTATNQQRTLLVIEVTREPEYLNALAALAENLGYSLEASD